MNAWHFLRNDGRLQWRCGRYSKPKVGQTLTVNPDKIELCRFGLHAGTRIIDALKYAPGAVVCRVELGGKIIKGSDKVVASERTIIQMADATNVLHEFACWCAERCLKIITNPDPRSIAAIEAKRKWLRGEITDDELYAARSVARSAAWSATWSARYAARYATWSARYAARYATMYAARYAAESAAWSAVRLAAESAGYAAWSAVRSAAESAGHAARSAAESAAESAQNRKLTRMINQLFKECE